MGVRRGRLFIRGSIQPEGALGNRQLCKSAGKNIRVAASSGRSQIELPMKKILCITIALVATALPVLAAPDTAYQALRTVGAQRGADSLKHVIEVEGKGGVPEPVVWRVVLDDPATTGGIRTLDVAHGKIIAEHTPVNSSTEPAAGAVMDFSKLNLDSAGAFTVVEKQAQKAKLGFDSVDYTLRAGDGPNANPVWSIHMMDASDHSVGDVSVAADSGALVASTLAGGPPPPIATAPPSTPDYAVDDADHDNLYTPAGEPAPVRQEDDSDTEDAHGLRIGHRIKQAILSAGESLKNFVTGLNPNH